MNKRLIKILSIIIFPLFIIVGFSTWIIVGNSEQDNIGQRGDEPPRAVAYISNAPTVTYTRIEKALEIANASATEAAPLIVYVIPGLVNSDGTIYNIHISKSCEIKANVTLALPYENETTYVSFLDYTSETWNSTFTDQAKAKQNGSTSATPAFADFNETLVAKYRKTLVTIAAFQTLTIHSGGTLLVGGMFGHTSQGLVGQTNGKYCEIGLESNAKIISTGNIKCYGYIKEATYENNGSMVILKSGYIEMPFIVYDFKGGSETYQIYSKYCPFSRYNVVNVQSILRVYSAAKIYGEARLAVSDANFAPKVTIVGSSYSNTALVLSSGFCELKYNPLSFGYTQNSTDEYTNASLEGSMTMGGIKLSISMKLMDLITVSVNIDTKNFHFPVPYNMKFLIKNGSILDLPNPVKFMQGSSIIIEKGATANILNEVVIYPTSSQTTENSVYPYPVTLPDAKFINNGIVNVSVSTTSTAYALCGVIDNKGNGAVVNYASTKQKSATVEDYETSYTLDSRIYYNNNLDTPVNISTYGTGVYVSSYNSSATRGSYSKFTVDFTVQYIHKTVNSSTEEVFSSSEISSSNLPTTLPVTSSISNLNTLSNRNGLYFCGWYLDGNFENKILENTITGVEFIDVAVNNTVKIYAKWSSVQPIVVSYYGRMNDASTPVFDKTLVHTKTELYLPGEIMILRNAVRSYEKISSDIKNVYGFAGWDIGGLDLIPERGEFEIPSNYSSKTLSISWTEGSPELFYKLIISDSLSSDGTGLTTLTNVDGFVVGNRYGTDTSFWVPFQTEITIGATGTKGGLLSTGKSRTVTAKSNGVELAKATSSGGGRGWGVATEVLSSFNMPKATVTITVS